MNYRKMIQVLLIILVAWFVAAHLLARVEEIRAYDWRFKYGYLAASFLLVLIVPLSVAFGWYLVLRLLGAKVRFPRCLKMMSLSVLAKYLPGLGWNYLAQAHMCQKEGVSKAAAGVSIILERSICFIAGVFAFLISLAAWGEPMPHGAVNLILLAIPVGLICIHPRILEQVINWLLRLMRRQAISIKINYASLLGLIAFYTIFAWGLGGVAFRLFIYSVLPTELSVIVTIGILALAVNVGLLAPFMPGGLVVREAMLVSFLQFYMPIEAAIMISVCYRFMDSLRELFFAGVALRL